MYLYLNEIEILNFIQETNLKVPSLVGNLQVKDLPCLKYFLGLESETEALARLGSSQAGRDVTHFSLRSQLTGGNTLDTEVFWRSDLSHHIQELVKNIGTVLDYVKLEKTSSDINGILDLMHDKVNEITEDLSIFSRMEVKLFFKPLNDLTKYLREITDSNVGLAKSLVDYYVGGIEYFCSFG